MTEILDLTLFFLSVFCPWQVVFEGIVGKSYQGDIAIDDLQLFNSPCPLPGNHC